MGNTALTNNKTLPKVSDKLSYKQKCILSVCLSPEHAKLTLIERAKIAGCSTRYFTHTTSQQKFKDIVISEVKAMLPNVLPEVWDAFVGSALGGSDKAMIAILTQAGVLDKPGTAPVTINIANIEAQRHSNLQAGLARFGVRTGECPADGGGTADMVEDTSSDLSENNIPTETQVDKEDHE